MIKASDFGSRFESVSGSTRSRCIQKSAATPLVLLCVLCVLCVESFGLDRNAFTFLHYNLQVRVDPAGEQMAARGTIQMRNDSAQPQSQLALQISSTLGWRLIHVDGQDVQYSENDYVSDIDHTGKLNEAVVLLPKPVAPGATITVEVGYEGPITRDASRLTAIHVPASTAARTDWDRIGEPVTVVRGIGYVEWYPVSLNAVRLSDPGYFDELAAWKKRERGSSIDTNLCWIADNEQLTVVADGSFRGVTRQTLGATEETTTHAGCSHYTFSHLGTTVPTFAIANYDTVAKPSIDVFHLADQASFAQEYAAAAEKVQPLESRWFGPPQGKVMVVQLPDPGVAAFEQGTMLITPFATLDAQALQARMMHQLVHASIDSPRPWIGEGLANFAVALFFADKGRATAVAYMDQILPALQEEEKHPSGQGLDESHDDIMFRGKAMFVWWMLRDMVGDSALQKAIGAYRAADDTSPGYMPGLIEKESRRDLAWFFDDWVDHDRGLPDFRVASAYPRATPAHSYIVAVTIENTGAAGAEVPVIVRTAEGDRVRRMLVKAHDKAVERIEVPAAPTEVIVNDGSVPESDMRNNTLAIARSSIQ